MGAPRPKTHYMSSLTHDQTRLQDQKTEEGLEGFVGFHGKSTIVGYSMPNPLNTLLLNI